MKHLVRNSWKFAALAVMVLSAPGASAATASASRGDRPVPARPNFILLLTDDQGWTDRSSPADPAYPDSCRGFFHTPGMDRLSRQGLTFTSGYAPAPVCTPTRRSIQFGMTPARICGTEFKSRFDPAGHLTLPQMLKQADPAYACAHFGKWGEYMIGLKGEFDDPRGEPRNLGYDVSDGYTGNVHGSCDPKTKFKLTADNQDPKRILSMTRKGLAFLKERAADGKPFYLQMSYYAIHRSPQARQATIDKYAGKGDPRGGEYTLNLPPMLDDLDSGIGQLLDAVRDLGLADKTYIFFGSDNGGAMPVRVPADQPGVPSRNQPLAFGKGTIYEGGVRVPVMVCGPGVPTNSLCHTPVVLYDLYATIHDLVGAKHPLPANIDAASLRDVMFNGDAGKVNRSTPGLVFHLPQRVHPHSSMRAGDYKLFVYWKDKNWGVRKVALYDLSKDIGEKNDISPLQPEKTRELLASLTAYLKAAGAEAPFVARLEQSDDR
jgi:arylsulfatase A